MTADCLTQQLFHRLNSHPASYCTFLKLGHSASFGGRSAWTLPLLPIPATTSGCGHQPTGGTYGEAFSRSPQRSLRVLFVPPLQLWFPPQSVSVINGEGQRYFSTTCLHIRFYEKEG